MTPPVPRPGDPALTGTVARQKKRTHYWAIWIPLLLVLVVAALFGVRLWLDAFLQGPDFRRFLDRKTSALLHADTQLQPLHWEGSEVYSDALDGTGYPGSPWARIGAEQIRAELNLRALWHGLWRIDSIDIAKVQAALGENAERPGALVSGAGETSQVAPEGTNPLARWLPTKVEVGKIQVADFSLSWTGSQPHAAGRLEGAELTAHPRQDENGWEIYGHQGRLTQVGLPILRLDQFTLKTNARELTVAQASGQAEGGGEVELSGSQQLTGDKALALDATFARLPIERFLPADWRARLHGSASGTVHLSGAPAGSDAWRAHGHVDLHDGRLEALPVLDALAVFTTTARFRQATLQVGSADFDWQGGVLTVSNFQLESEGLIRLEGGFNVRNEQIDGQLQVGVARSAGRLLAGIGARVFNEPERDGYLWTAVRLTGPVRDPNEDLTARLVEATHEEVVQKAQQGAATVLDTASGLLNLLQPPH